MKTNWFKRTLCTILVFVMVMGYVPVVEGQGCKCQPDEKGKIVHTEGCGYVESVAEVPCGHVCSEETGCVEKAQNCQHQHDDNCGYVKTIPECPCSYSCRECAKSESSGTPYDEECETLVFCETDYQDELMVYHYVVNASLGETVTLAVQPDVENTDTLSVQWMIWNTDNCSYENYWVEDKSNNTEIFVTISELDLEKKDRYACYVSDGTKHGTAIFDIIVNQSIKRSSAFAVALATPPDSSSESWLWPVPQNLNVYSPFNLGNQALQNIRGGTHNGIDISRNARLRVVAARTGVVVYVKSTGYNTANQGLTGNALNEPTVRVILKHQVGNSVFYSQYLHLESGSAVYYETTDDHTAYQAITVGDVIKQGTQIGITGDTGNAGGIHLHFAVGTGYSGGWVRNHICTNPKDNTNIHSNNSSRYSDAQICASCGEYGSGIAYVIQQGTNPPADDKTPVLNISGWRDLTQLDVGSNFGLRGTISTDCGVITSVTGSVHNSSGGVVLTHTDTPNTSTYNIQAGINNYLSFGRLSNGRYTIKVQATANNNGKTNTLELVNQSFTVGSINYYSFDINGLLDNVDEPYLGDFGTCDVYISGELVADDCDDYYSQSIPEGSTYEIRDIRATDGHNYAGVYTGQLSGTVSGDTTVVLKFFSNPKANLSQSATDIVVDKYGAYITFSYTGDTAHGYGYTITSSDSSVATVNFLNENSFAVNGVSVGTCKIVFQLVETDTYAILDTAECTVTVSREGVFGDGLAYNVTPEGHMTISGDGSIPDYNEERSPWVNWCSEIKKLTLSNGITGIGWSAFLSCDSLTEVTIANTVTDIEPSAFAHCTALQNVEIPGSVNTIQDGAFVGCSELKTVTLSEGVNCLQDGVFMNCSSLKNISIPQSMSSIGSYSFYNCVSLADVHYAGSIAQWGALRIEDHNEALINANIQCDAPTIGGTCGEKLVWTLSDGVLTISGSGDMWDYSLDGEDTPWRSYRDAITSVVIEKGVTRVGDHAFEWCVKLEDVSLPNSIISIGFFAFGECYSLRSFTIPNGVTTIENDAFALCHNLSAISIPNSVVSIGDFAFTGCSSLSAITLPANLTSIGNGVFWGCGLSSIVIPNGVTSIGNDAFEKCSGMSSITLPDTVSTIGISSFSDCTSLITITIPDSLTTIGNYAFDNCTSLTSVTFEGTAPTIGIGAFRGVTANVYYPAEDATWTSDVMQNYFGTLTWIPYGDHEHFYTAVITAPTCTEQGYTTYTCNCGNYYVDDYVNALGHSETIVTGTSATCTEPGMTDGKVCKVCGVFTVKCEIIKALGHTEETISGKAATCTEDGLTDGTKCRLCDKILVPQEVIPAGHTIEESGYKEPTCTEDGMSALKVCIVCGETIEEQQILPAGHKPVHKKLQKATAKEDGIQAHYECSVCRIYLTDETGDVEANEEDYKIPAVDIVRLSSTRYSYDGKTKTPKVGVYDSEGNKLVRDKDYTVTYAKGRKSVGQYNVTMKGTGDYDFRTTLTFQIVPPKSGIKALSGKSKAFTASWSKKTSQVTGYQLQYSLDKNFETGVKTVTIKDNDVTSKTIKSLKSKKYYYVRIRTYKTVSGKNFYSGWSDAARVKTK